MVEDFLGVGWKFPVKADYNSKIAMSSYEEDIKEAIKIILWTKKGERVMRPDFGCGIHNLIFASINTTAISSVENSIREALLMWEPRIELIKVTVSQEQSEEGKLLIGIDYRIRVTNNRFNLVYPFYLNEGA